MPLERPKFLSPSSISTFQQCPLKFRYGRIDKLPDPPGIEAVVGSFVHATMEDLFRVPAEQRTVQTAKRLMLDQWRNEWKAKIEDVTRDLHMAQWQAWWCIENYFEIEDPTRFELDAIEQYVEGEIAGARVRGYIDRYYANGKGVVVGDYKSGKAPAPRFADAKFQQLLVYAKLLVDQGTPVDSVELLFLKDGVRLKRQVRPSDLQVVEDTVAAVSDELDRCCATESFEPKPSRLCDWCSFKPLCPAHQKA